MDEKTALKEDGNKFVDIQLSGYYQTASCIFFKSLLQ